MFQGIMSILLIMSLTPINHPVVLIFHLTSNSQSIISNCSHFTLYQFLVSYRHLKRSKLVGTISISPINISYKFMVNLNHQIYTEIIELKVTVVIRIFERLRQLIFYITQLSSNFMPQPFSENPQPKIKIPKFRRTYSPHYRLHKSTSSQSLSAYLSSFNAKLKCLQGNNQTNGINIRSPATNPHERSIRSKRLKLIHDQNSDIKVGQFLPKQQLVEDAKKQVDYIKIIKALADENQGLKQKVKTMEKQIEQLKAAIDEKDTDIPNMTVTFGDFKKAEDIQNIYHSHESDQTDLTSSLKIPSTDSSCVCAENCFHEVWNTKQYQQLAEELRETRGQLEKMQIAHDLALRKVNKQLDFYRNNKDKELMILKQKFKDLLYKYKEASKKAASLQIQSLIDKKWRGQTQAQNLTLCNKDYEQFYALSSDDDHFPN